MNHIIVKNLSSENVRRLLVFSKLLFDDVEINGVYKLSNPDGKILIIFTDEAGKNEILKNEHWKQFKDLIYVINSDQQLCNFLNAQNMRYVCDYVDYSSKLILQPTTTLKADFEYDFRHLNSQKDFDVNLFYDNSIKQNIFDDWDLSDDEDFDFDVPEEDDYDNPNLDDVIDHDQQFYDLFSNDEENKVYDFRINNNDTEDLLKSFDSDTDDLFKPFDDDFGALSSESSESNDGLFSDIVNTLDCRMQNGFNIHLVTKDKEMFKRFLHTMSMI